MEITDIRIYKVAEPGDRPFLGSANITIDDAIAIHGVSVLKGERGNYISFPSRKRADGSFVDIVHPINSETRDAIQTAILEKFAEA